MYFLISQTWIHQVKFDYRCVCSPTSNSRVYLEPSPTSTMDCTKNKVFHSAFFSVNVTEEILNEKLSLCAVNQLLFTKKSIVNFRLGRKFLNAPLQVIQVFT